jgi:glycosyltransferase involved in cell wall biosynthesis
MFSKSATENAHPVLYFTNSRLWGGAEEHMSILLRGLERGIFRPHLVCDPDISERFARAIPADVEITPLRLSSAGHFATAIRLARLCVRRRFRIVHSHMFLSSLFASPIAWACRVPIIVETLHGTEAWRKGWKATYIVDRATVRFVSKYVAVSQSDATFLGNKKRVPANKITIIRNGVDTRRFAKQAGAGYAIRQKLGFAQEDIVLIMVARFHSGKGHRVLLEAMRDLLRSHTTLKLICLGEGELEEEVRGVCEKLRLGESIRLVGQHPNVPEWLAASDINVLPSFYEGLPLTVLEAMASGLPTVATNVGGIPEAIEHGVNGLLVPPGDAKCLAQAIAVLVGDVQKRIRFGRAAQARAVQHFNYESQVIRTQQMYLEMLNEKKVAAIQQPDGRAFQPQEPSEMEDGHQDTSYSGNAYAFRN